MQIGSYNTKNNVFLAPMLAVNCPAFLKLCSDYGAGLVYTQFIDSDDYVLEGNVFDKEKFLKKNKYIFDIHPIAVQIIGSKKENLLKLMKELDGKVEVIDVNLGCPLAEQLAKKAGVFFMKHPEFIKKVFSDILSNIKTPVTCKIRGGWDDEHINAVEVCKILEKTGFAAIAIHARSGKQGYTGKNDWELIRKCKEAVKVPIIGSGDITKPGHAKYYLERKYCDAVMIGREAQKNPYMIKQCIALLEEGKNILDKPKKEQFLDFYKIYSKDKDCMKINELKDHAMWFASDLKNSSQLKKLILESQSFDDILEIFMNL
jgi:tRNA-dihydrouridine synthase B